VIQLRADAICCAVHPSLEVACPVCGAEPDEECRDDGEFLPQWAVHIGRTTGGDCLFVEPTENETIDGTTVFKAVNINN
jgi:hypothetical protein